MKKGDSTILAIGFVLLWNSGFVGAEYALPYTGPFTLLFWRYLALTIVVFGFLLVTKRFRWVGWKVAGPNMLIGVLAHGVWLTCVLLALDNGVPAGIVALVVALQPLITGALSGRYVGEQTNNYQWIGLVIGFLGVALTVGFRMDFNNYTSIFSYLIPLGSVVAITIANLIQRRMDVKKMKSKLPLIPALFYQSLATTLALALPAIFIEKLSTQWPPEFIYTMIWLILGVSLGAYALMYLLIDRLDATRVACLFYLGPPATMLMAWIAFGDKVKIMDVVGIVLVAIGVLFIQLNARRASYAP